MDTAVLIAIVGIVLVVAVAGFIVLSRRRDESGTPTLAPPDDTEAPTREAPPVDTDLRSRLGRSRSALAASLAGVFSSDALDDGTWEDLEDALVMADVGPGTADEVVRAVKADRPATADEAQAALRAHLVEVLDRDDRALHIASHPAVVVVVGVNGSGKTTSIAKIANDLVTEGKTVVLGAADTFRAAADTQLRTWGDRVGVPVVSGAEGSDPASVAYEAYQRAAADGADAVIVDTAGRLHSQSNLMDELGKVVRVLNRESGGVDEILLVLDGTVGQNGLAQAHAFTEAVGVTGVVISKLDGTARGGVAIAIERDLDVPVKLIGVGEGMDDLIPFVPGDFVDALVAP